MSAAVQSVRQLLNIPDDYHVLYLHGGAHAVFAALPLNLAGDKTSADYVSVSFCASHGGTTCLCECVCVCVHV